MSEEDDTFGIVLFRNIVDGKGVIGHRKDDTNTLYAALEGFVATGNTLEILGYYPRTTTWKRKDIYYDTLEAEEIYRD
jgi:hypothetical protein